MIDRLNECLILAEATGNENYIDEYKELIKEAYEDSRIISEAKSEKEKTESKARKVFVKKLQTIVKDVFQNYNVIAKFNSYKSANFLKGETNSISFSAKSVYLSNFLVSPVANSVNANIRANSAGNINKAINSSKNDILKDISNKCGCRAENITFAMKGKKPYITIKFSDKVIFTESVLDEFKSFDKEFICETIEEWYNENNYEINDYEQGRINMFVESIVRPTRHQKQQKYRMGKNGLEPFNPEEEDRKISQAIYNDFRRKYPRKEEDEDFKYI